MDLNLIHTPQASATFDGLTSWPSSVSSTVPSSPSLPLFLAIVMSNCFRINIYQMDLLHQLKLTSTDTSHGLMTHFTQRTAISQFTNSPLSLSVYLSLAYFTFFLVLIYLFSVHFFKIELKWRAVQRIQELTGTSFHLFYGSLMTGRWHKVINPSKISWAFKQGKRMSWKPKQQLVPAFITFDSTWLVFYFYFFAGLAE